MKYHASLRLLSAILSIPFAALVLSAEPSALSESERGALLQKAHSIQRAFATGDAESIIRSTHPAILKFFGSREEFEKTTREAFKSLAGRVTIEKTDWGAPSSLHSHGSEDVVFLPRTDIMRVGNKRARSIGFLIAARPKGTNDWLFLECAQIRKDLAFLWQLFPALPKDVVVPPISIEILDER